MIEMIDYHKLGKDNRKIGLEFENKVRIDLEDNYIVAKLTNNIDVEKGCFVKAKQKFIGGRVAGLGSGFPDFIAFSPRTVNKEKITGYNLIFVEAKRNGRLKPEEKKKMQFLLNEGHSAWIAYEGENGEICYRKFMEQQKSSPVRRKPTRH